MQVSSPTNTIDSAIFGASITLLKKDPATTVTLSVTEDLSAGKQQIKDFVSAFNDLLSFAADQSSAALKGQTDNIGRDALLRGLRSQLRSNLSSQYATGGKFSYLSQVGLGFDRSGKLTFDENVYDEAVKGGTDAVQKLFTGGGGVTGAFATLKSSIAVVHRRGRPAAQREGRIDAQLQNVGDADRRHERSPESAACGAAEGISGDRQHHFVVEQLGEFAGNTLEPVPSLLVGGTAPADRDTRGRRPMQGVQARGANAYIQTHVQSRSPLELVVMLYDGAVRFLTEARTAIEQNDLGRKRSAMSRALAIISELQSTLNLEQGGEIAIQLDALYTYINGRMLDASMKNDLAALDESVRLLSTLRSGWSEIAAREAAPPVTTRA